MNVPALLANDRSLRSRDIDGRLHVEKTRISKANVCAYLGREIPNCAALGLNPAGVYRLYRDPLELTAAAASFNNLPLMIKHVGVNANNPQQDLIVGTLGSDTHFEDPYLVTSLAVWTSEAIGLIEAGVQEELSSSYRYVADMTPGTAPDGLQYDGVMRNIIGNHVALVEEGRAGPDVIVADEKPPELKKMRFSKTIAAILAAFGASAAKPTDEQLLAVDSAMSEEMGEDGLSDLEKKAACDAKMLELGKDSLNEEEKSDAYKRAAKDKKTAADAAAVKPVVMDEVPKDYVSKADAEKLATDAATKAVADAIAARDALHAARKAVEPVVGVIAMDSAAEVYGYALDHLKVDRKGVDASAYATIFALATKAPVAAAPAPVLAVDSAEGKAAKAFNDRVFGRIKQG